MALPELHSLKEVFLTCHSPSIATTPIVARLVSPVRGRIKRLYMTISGAITVADCSVAVAINGTAVTGGTLR